MDESIQGKLEQAIAAMTAAQTNENLFAVLQLLGDMLEQEAQVVVPADKMRDPDTQAGQEDRFQFRMLQASDGSALMVCFTSMAELERGAPSTAVKLPLGQLLETAMSNEQVGGIVINPWGQPFRLTRQLLEMLAQMAEEVQSDCQLCSADHVPDEFIVQVRNAGVLLKDIRCIAIAGLLRQGEGSFLLLVECEPGIDQTKTFERLQSHLLPTVLPVDVAPLEGELPEFARVIYRKL